MPSLKRPVVARVLSFLALAWIGFAAAQGGVAAQTAVQGSKDLEFFETKVRPLLVEKCQSCHGETKPKGGLSLINRSRLVAGGSSGRS